MHWGIQKEEVSTSSPKKKGGVKGSELFPKDVEVALDSVTSKLKKSYGFKVDEIKPIGKNPLYRKYFAYVELGTKTNTIHLRNDSKLTKKLLKNEKNGWLVDSQHHVLEGLVTHEAAHSMFHTDKAQKQFGKVREKALTSAINQAIKDGTIKDANTFPKKIIYGNNKYQLSKKISKYAENSLFDEEPEAEMFSAYHWSKNPPKFIDAYAKELHVGVGKQVQPFSGRKVSHVGS